MYGKCDIAPDPPYFAETRASGVVPRNSLIAFNTENAFTAHVYIIAFVVRISQRALAFNLGTLNLKRFRETRDVKEIYDGAPDKCVLRNYARRDK